KSHSDADVQKSIAYGKQMKIYPLAQAANPSATVFTDVKEIDFNSTIRYDASFFEHLDRIVQNEPWIDRDRGLIDPIRSLGIEKGKPFRCGDRLQAEECSGDFKWVHINIAIKHWTAPVQTGSEIARSIVAGCFVKRCH